MEGKKRDVYFVKEENEIDLFSKEDSKIDWDKYIEDNFYDIRKLAKKNSEVKKMNEIWQIINNAKN